jgi:NitT/TauT family transport system substrate-binding protein
MEGNLFEKYGLRVEQTNISGSGASLAALTSNEIQFLYCAADATIAGMASGIEAKLVAAPLVGLVWLMIARPEVRTMADLRGKSVGIPRVGDLADRLSRLALERNGLRPNVDVDLRPTGGSQPERYQALLMDVVQGNVLTPPMDARARQDGLNIVYDLADLGIPSIYSSAHASNTAIRDNPQMVQRFVAAMAEAVHFTEKSPEVARQALRKVLNLEDPDALDSAYRAYAQKHINRRLSVPFDAVSAGIEDAREQGSPVVARGPEDIATNQFADDLERTGFLQQLWGAELPPK